MTIPILFGFCFRDLMEVVRKERLWRMVRHLPYSIQVERQEDGAMVAFVERLDGDPSIVTLPDGYDPREDDGRYLFELLTQQDDYPQP